MTDERISELPEATSLTEDDLFVIVAGGINKRITEGNVVSALQDAFNAPRWIDFPDGSFDSTPPTEKYSAGGFTSIQDWSSGSYSVGDYATPSSADGFIYECVEQTGNTGPSEPTWNNSLGALTSDGSVKWCARGYHVIATNDDLTDILAVGYPLRYTNNSVHRYGMVLGITSDRIAVMGAPLIEGDTIDALAYGSPEMVVQLPLCPTTGAPDWVYGSLSAGTDLLAQLPQYICWTLGRAYCVGFRAKHKINHDGSEDTNTDDPTDQPMVNLAVAGSEVSPTVGTAAISPGTGVHPYVTWQDNSPVAIDVSAYQIDRGDDITLLLTQQTGTAAGLSAMAVFVLE